MFLLLISLLLISNCLSYNIYNNRRIRRLNSSMNNKKLMSNNDNNINEKTLEELLDSVSDLTQDEVPQDISDAINNKIRDKIKDSEPSDLQIRLQIMGFTPLTYAGFALAGILIFLNTTLGTGWASTLLHLNDNNNQQQYEQSIIEGLKYRNSQIE